MAGSGSHQTPPLNLWREEVKQSTAMTYCHLSWTVQWVCLPAIHLKCQVTTEPVLLPTEVFFRYLFGSIYTKVHSYWGPNLVAVIYLFLNISTDFFLYNRLYCILYNELFLRMLTFWRKRWQKSKGQTSVCSLHVLDHAYVLNVSPCSVWSKQPNPHTWHIR